jgi:hypothetical protein
MSVPQRRPTFTAAWGKTRPFRFVFQEHVGADAVGDDFRLSPTQGNRFFSVWQPGNTGSSQGGAGGRLKEKYS